MPFGERNDPYIPGYGKARKKRPDIESPRRRRPKAGPPAPRRTSPAVERSALYKALRQEPREIAPGIPSLLGLTKAQRETLERKGAEASARQEQLANRVQQRGAPSALEVLEIASLGFPGLGAAGLAVKGARAGLAAKGLLTAGRAVKASEKVAAKATSKALARRGGVRRAAKRGMAKAEPRRVTKVRRATAQRAGRAVKKVPKPVRTAGKIAGRAATTPLKHPFTAPLAAQAPSAVVNKDPGEFAKALEGSGTFAAIGNAVGGAVASVTPGKVAQNIVRDAFNLPAVVLPSAYIPAAGIVEASKGDSSRLRTLWKDYVDSGAIPALARGDTDAALKAIEDHPLYTALEASGAASVGGRTAGALARGASGGRVGGTARPPLTVKGYEQLGNVRKNPRYSPDLLRQVVQRAADRKRVAKRGGHHTSPRETKRALLDAGDRFAYGADQIRRTNRENTIAAIHQGRPKKGRLRTDRASAGVVAQAVQRIARSPETFVDDLASYKTSLDKAYKAGNLTPSQRTANRQLAADIERGLKDGDPEAIVRSANVFIEHHNEILEGLVERGLYTPEQAAKAAVIPFARVHMRADHDPKVGVVGPDGKALSLKEITAEMERQGIEPPGFLTQRPSMRGGRNFYRAWFPERAGGTRQSRTGAATAAGTYDASYQALVEQAVGSRGTLDAVENWDRFIKTFGIAPPKSVKTFNDAWRVLEDPEHHGLRVPEGERLVPVRRHPFLALKREIDAALYHQDPADPAQQTQIDNLAHQAITEATKDGPGPIVFMPARLVTRMEEHHARTTEAGKAGQVVTGAFKKALLPTSPSFYFGNAIDNYMRTALAGIGPSDVRLGRKLAKEMDQGALQSVIPGAGYGSVSRVQAYRDARQFQDSGPVLGALARSLGALRRTPGPKHLVDAYMAYTDLALRANSRFFERLPQYGALGKEARREFQATHGRWNHALTVGPDAVKELASGIRGAKAIQYAKAVEEVFGNWGKNSPWTRRVLTNFAPFWMWARASTRFVLLTMPAHHPIKTGLIAAAAEMTEQERAKLGLDKFVGGAPLPGFAQGGLPIRGSISPWGKYTSFGVFADYPSFAARLFFPQGSSVLQGLQGLDWKGDQLVDANGRPVKEPQAVAAAALAGAEAFIPFLNVVSAFQSGGIGKAVSPVHVYPSGQVRFFRSLANSQQITVPVKGTQSGAAPDYSRIATGGGDSSVDYSKVAAGG